MAIPRHQRKIAKNLLSVLGGCCYICNNAMNDKEISKDHVFPKSMGYSISGNMMPSHAECNRIKGDRVPTRAEIDRSISAYEKIGSIFNPVLIRDKHLITKPIDYLFYTCKQG